MDRYRSAECSFYYSSLSTTASSATTDARLERQLAAIRDAGDPLTLADLARKPIPPGNECRYVSSPSRARRQGDHVICFILTSTTPL